MEYIEIEAFDVESSPTPSEAFALIMREKEGNREMTIVIGLHEARTLVILISNINTRRPGTHELFKNFMKQAGYQLNRVEIYHYDEGVFYAHLLIHNDDGHYFELDARTSDAIAIALITKSIITIKKDIFDKLSVISQKNEEKIEDLATDFDLQPDELEDYIEHKLQEMSVGELERLLQDAIAGEDFELASKIHEEINARKS